MSNKNYQSVVAITDLIGSRILIPVTSILWINLSDCRVNLGEWELRFPPGKEWDDLVEQWTLYQNSKHEKTEKKAPSESRQKSRKLPKA